MKQSNIDGRTRVEQNRKLLTAVRRSDVALQFRGQMVEKGIKNVDIAEVLGVSEANVSRWLKGDQNLSLDTMFQLADAINEDLRIVLGTAKAQAAHIQDSCSWSSEDWTEVSQEGEVGNVVLFEDYVHLRRSVTAQGLRPVRSEALLWRNG